MNKLLLLFLFCVCLGCTHAPNTPVIHISLTKSSLQITGIDPAILRDINRDTASNWQSLFAVYRLPADTDLKNYQPIQPGHYQLKNNALLFTPDTPFIKQQTYFLRYYQYQGNKSVWDYVKGKTQVGKLHFIDLTFKQ